MKKMFYKYEEIIKYLIIGGLTTIVSISSYLILRNFIFNHNTQLHIQISNILSFVFAIIFSYYFNHKWVFNTKKQSIEKIKEFYKFFLSRIFSLLVEVLVMFIFTNFVGMNDGIAKLIVQVIVIITNYITGKLFVFIKDSKI